MSYILDALKKVEHEIRKESTEELFKLLEISNWESFRSKYKKEIETESENYTRKSKKFNNDLNRRYYWQARYFPAFFCSTPILILGWILIEALVSPQLASFTIVGWVVLWIFLVSLFGRIFISIKSSLERIIDSSSAIL